MPLPIRDYAIIGDLHTAALVGIDGSIDWLCLPRFDSDSTFAALLGEKDHGRWKLAPVKAHRATSRRYLDSTFVLVTRWETEQGTIEVTDFMPVHDRRADLVRRVRGISGEVEIEQDLRIRFGYAGALPWVRQAPVDDRQEIGSTTMLAVAGPDAIAVSGVHFEPHRKSHQARFTVRAGETVDTVMTWYPSYRDSPSMPDVDRQLERTIAWWRDWCDPGVVDDAYSDQVRRSLLVLRALTDEDTGGIAAAVTTSLPESPGGSRNWDYRYVWLRDAALTLEALIQHGHVEEAGEWRRWLLRAIAGDPADVQIMYGLSGERRLPEWEVPTLPGYRGASPVRVGNAAYTQYQGDVFGEVFRALQSARDAGVEENRFSWSLQVALLSFVEENLERKDSGIWEIRGEERFFVQSRASIWAAFDAAIDGVRRHGLEGDADHWERIRDGLRTEIEDRGFDPARNSYRQHYATDEVDASLLLLPSLGYIEPDDPRMLGTVARIEKDLLSGGLLRRYRTASGVDGLEGTEGAFLACSFWLVRQYALSGRLADATTLMDRLCGLANDVGLLAEQVDPESGDHLGNTPQALSHLALAQAARAITTARRASDPTS